jgi:hypothetical protein
MLAGYQKQKVHFRELISNSECPLLIMSVPRCEQCQGQLKVQKGKFYRVISLNRPVPRHPRRARASRGRELESGSCAEPLADSVSRAGLSAFARSFG